MFVRLGLAHEEDLFVDMARVMAAESYPHMPFSEERTRATYQSYLKTAQPTFFFCDDGKGGVAGILEASISACQYTDGIYTTLCGTFVHPDKRGSRAAALLLSAFTRWSDQLGAIESTGGNDNNLTTERTTRLLGHFGFKPVGTFVRRRRGG